MSCYTVHLIVNVALGRTNAHAMIGQAESAANSNVRIYDRDGRRNRRARIFGESQCEAVRVEK